MPLYGTLWKANNWFATHSVYNSGSLLQMVLFLSILLTIHGFFSTYSTNTKEATDFIDQHPEILENLSGNMSNEEAIMALAIVAPEISQYSTAIDKIQIRSLSISYILYGQGNFSIGYFQMKPSFAKTIETIVSNHEELRLQYPQLILDTQDETDKMTQREQRHTRLKRLASLDWQCQYLAAFISIVKKRTENMSFDSDLDRLRYWATLYNGGINLPETQVRALQGRRQFPYFGIKKFNYADVVTEFYQYLTGQ